MKLHVPVLTVAAAVTASLLMVFVVPAGASAAPTPSAANADASYTLWAYGAVRTVHFSGVGVSGWAYTGTATYGYSVILDQTNITSTSFEISMNRTMGAAVTIEYCTPNCNTPTATATVNYRAWESLGAWVNFTTAGTVYEDGAPTPALAILNSHAALSGNVTDSVKSAKRTGFLSYNLTAAVSVDFATPLGLFPDTLESGTSWNSTSDFSASGFYFLQYFFHYKGPLLNVTVGPKTVSGAAEGTGNVSVVGSVGGSSVSLGGQSYQNVSLELIGPFVAREGFVLIPSGADLFGTPLNATADEASGTASAEMSAIDVRMGHLAHLGIGGSEWVYAASAANPSATSLDPSAPSGAAVTSLASGADALAPTPVQGEPIPVDQATQYQGCLLSGTNCPSGGSSPARIPLLGIGAAVVVVAVVALSVVVVQRRREPPTVYPNASLYPPGSGRTPGTRPPAAGPGSPPPAPAPAEEDPLSNLW